MKRFFSSGIVLFLVLILSITASFAQDYQQWHLPEGATVRLGKGHIGEIAHSPDGTRLAVASSIGIWIYDASTGTEEALLIEDIGRVYSVAFSPDGTTIAGGDYVGEVHLWEVTTGKHINILKHTSGHSLNNKVYSVAFSPDGTTIAGGGYQEVWLWEVATGKRINTFTGYTSYVENVTFNPDGTIIAASGSEFIKLGTAHHTVHLWEVETGKRINTFEHTGKVRSVAFSPDGTIIATSGGRTGGSNNWLAWTVQLWEVTTGKRINILTGHTNTVPSVAFSPDGTIIASGSRDWAVHLWEVETGKRTNTFEHTGVVSSIAFSPDGTTIISGNHSGEVHLWEVETGKNINTFTLTGHTGDVSSVAFSPDSTTLASGGGSFYGPFTGFFNEGHLWEVETGNHINTLTGHSTFTGHSPHTRNLAFSPDGTIVANDGLWEVETGKYIGPLVGSSSSVTTRSIAFSPDGRIIAGGSYQGVHLWEVETRKRINTLKIPNAEHISGPSVGVSSVTFSPDGRILAGGSYQGVHLWEVATEKYIDTFTRGPSYVLSVAFSPDGTIIASGRGYGWGVDLWEVETGKHINTLTELHTYDVSSVAFSPDGTIIAGAESDYASSQTGPRTVHLWEVETGKHINTLIGHADDVLSVAFSPDGTTLASGSADNTVLLWDIMSVLSGHKKIAADINGDGAVNIQDLVAVAAALGKPGENNADLNGDGVVNIQDLVVVAAALGEALAAPSAIRYQNTGQLTPADVQQWFLQIQQLDLKDPTTQRGILFLQYLLAVLTPKETTLLANYPNPFNPETWIPYQLAKSADVTLTIYDINGRVVRDLDLGHQRAGVYHSRARAAHWDGRNGQGEPVASGVYFYTLTAGDFTATRKMLIRK